MDIQKAEKTIRDSATESAKTLERTVQRLAPDIAAAAGAIASAIAAGGKVLVCGNGGSAADSQHMAAEIVGRFLRERGAWPAIALSTDTSILTSISNDYGYEMVFSRQVEAHGERGDVLVGISTSGNSGNVIRALEAARAAAIKTISLTGRGGGKMAALSDILIDADSTHTPHIQEAHGFIIHVLCDLVERELIEDA